MSYQSGYQYTDVPSSEDPLSIQSNNPQTNTNTNTNVNTNTSFNSNNANINNGTVNNNNNSSMNSHQQHSQGLSSSSSVASASSSTYTPRAYLPTYHEYTQNPIGGMQTNNINNMYPMNGSVGSFGSYGPNFGGNTWIESNRRSRRNRIMIGLIIGVFLLMIMGHHPATDNSNNGIASESAGGIPSSNETSEENGNDDDHVNNGANTDSDNTATAATNDESSSTNTSNNIEHEHEHTPDSSDTPKISYLLTYPMSGTTYAMDMIKDSTNMAIATNYEVYRSYRDEENDPRPICMDYTNLIPEEQTKEGYGFPFWTMSYKSGKIPTNHVVTLSHCDGYCLTPCTPSEYIHTESSFEESCRTVLYHERKSSSSSSSSSENKENNNKEHNEHLQEIDLQSVITPKNAIDSILHLIRDPFSNIVSRYHQYLIVQELEQGLHNSKESFHEWCRDMDTNQTLIELEEEKSKHYFSSEIRSMFRKVPCHAEFVKYISWHNHVVEMSWIDNYKSLPIYFEDFANVARREDVAKEIAEFVGYEVVNLNLPTFFGGKMYRDQFYNREQINAVTELLKLMSFSQTWDMLERYFDDL